MRKLILRNAKVEMLTPNKVSFIGELKGYVTRVKYTITKERYEDLLQLEHDVKYDIWRAEENFIFRPKN